MTKTICISISDHIYNTYLAEIKTNRSQYVEKLIVVGSESQLGQDETIKIRLIKANQTIVEKDQEIHKLKLEIGKQKSLLKKRKDTKPKEDLTPLTAMYPRD